MKNRLFKKISDILSDAFLKWIFEPDTATSREDFSHAVNKKRLTLINDDYVIENGTLRKYKGNACNVIIPEGTTDLGICCFIEENDHIESVTIPSSVNSIGFDFWGDFGGSIIYNSVFSSCSSLREINVDENNRCFSSEDGVLYNKEKTELCEYPPARGGVWTIPKKVKRIEATAFEGCKLLEKIIIPKGVVSIGEEAFLGCLMLSELNIPASVKKIERIPFGGCKSLKEINVDKKNTEYTSVDGVLYNKDITQIIRCPSGYTQEEFIIPDTVTCIGEDAFVWCYNLTNVIIPNSIARISEDAFGGCNNLTDIIIPSNVTEIQQDVFSGCGRLTIHCCKNSCAHTYAVKNNIPFTFVD